MFWQGLLMSDAVHTGGESLQDGLGDMQTCGMTLASAYVLCHLSATWLQFSNGRKESKMEVSTDWCVTVEY